MKMRSIIAIIACLSSVALLPVANESFSTFVFVSPAILAVIGIVAAILAILNKNENRKWARFALVINLCTVGGFLLFLLYMGFFWQL